MDYGYKLVLARTPRREQRRVLLKALGGFLSGYRENAEAAREFLKQGESRLRPGIDERELAAYTAVASLLLNLDETITKQ